MVLNICYFHTYLGKIPILTIIFFKWVETTNQRKIICFLNWPWSFEIWNGKLMKWTWLWVWFAYVCFVACRSRCWTYIFMNAFWSAGSLRLTSLRMSQLREFCCFDVRANMHFVRPCTVFKYTCIVSICWMFWDEKYVPKYFRRNWWFTFLSRVKSPTVPETNIAPENRPSQKEISIPTIHFQVLCWFQGG